MQNHLNLINFIIKNCESHSFIKIKLRKLIILLDSTFFIQKSNYLLLINFQLE